MIKNKSSTKEFDYSAFPDGFYDQVMDSGHPIRKAWHLQKFLRVLTLISKKPSQSLLDIGCFAGTFLGLIDESYFSKQVGVDILPNQINYAQIKYKTSFRNFKTIRSITSLDELDEKFNVITLIEVIEHLKQEEINMLFSKLDNILKPNGKIIISTPNYLSFWPIIELALNRFSDISYEEQHHTKFRYFDIERKITKIYPEFFTKYKFSLKTTSHFISPFLAIFSLKFAMKISEYFPQKKWHFPFGNLIILIIERND